MSYRRTRKRKKIWSEQALAKKERTRLENAESRPIDDDIDPFIRIEVYRRHTGETAIFECFEGTRIDNYSVHCNQKHLGIMGISELTRMIGKALPSFRRMEE